MLHQPDPPLRCAHVQWRAPECCCRRTRGFGIPILVSGQEIMLITQGGPSCTTLSSSFPPPSSSSCWSPCCATPCVFVLFVAFGLMHSVHRFQNNLCLGHLRAQPISLRGFLFFVGFLRVGAPVDSSVGRVSLAVPTPEPPRLPPNPPHTQDKAESQIRYPSQVKLNWPRTATTDSNRNCTVYCLHINMRIKVRFPS